MYKLITATGREIACDAVVRASRYEFLTIHTDQLSRVEVDTIFEDSSETETLTAIQIVEVTDENGEIQRAELTTVYRGFTVLDTVQRSPLFPNPGELMIWLTRPEE